jgi:PKD repeat protein
MNNYSTVIENGVTYQWTVNGGQVVSGNGSGNVSVIWNTPGTHQITLTAINPATGCDSITYFSVTTDSLAEAVIQTGNLSGCAPVSRLFAGGTYHPAYHYSWNFGDGTFSSEYSHLHHYHFSGSYPVMLIVTNNTGCADTVVSQITVYPSPVADF